MVSVSGTEQIWTGARRGRLAAAMALAVLSPAATAGEVRVTVDGIRSSNGMVLIGLYDSQASFETALNAADKEAFLIDPDRFGAVALRANAALKSAVVFGNLDPGQYAAIVFHDENANGKLDRNFLGVPSEPYGFSNNVQGFFSPPSFAAAAMPLGDGNQAIRIKMIYQGGAQ
jgi:uncharacterized protein (DUF2141 family)